MKNSKTIVVLSLLLLGLLLFALLFELPGKKYDESKKEINQPLIANLMSEDVTKIQIMKGSENIILEKGKTNFMIKGEVNFPASPDLIAGFIDTIVNLKMGNVTSINEDKHVEFGVNSELGTRVILFAGEEEKVNIVVGNSADAGGTYIKKKGETEVYLVKTFISSEISRNADDWRDKTIISFNEEDAKEISIKSGEQKAVYNKDSEGNWRKLETEKSQDNISSIITTLGSLKGFEIVESTDFVAHNLEDGTEDTKVYIKFNEGEDTILVIGFANEEYYARDFRKDIIYKIGESIVEEIKAVL